MSALHSYKRAILDFTPEQQEAVAPIVQTADDARAAHEQAATLYVQKRDEFARAHYNSQGQADGNSPAFKSLEAEFYQAASDYKATETTWRKADMNAIRAISRVCNERSNARFVAAQLARSQGQMQ